MCYRYMHRPGCPVTPDVAVAGSRKAWQRNDVLQAPALPCLHDGKRWIDTLMFRLTGSACRFPYFDKLWLMLGQLEERQGRTEAARQVLSSFSCWHCCLLDHCALSVARLYPGRWPRQCLQGSCVVAPCVQRQCGRYHATHLMWFCSVLGLPECQLSCCWEQWPLLGRQ